MRRGLLALAVGLAALVLALVVATLLVSRPDFDERLDRRRLGDWPIAPPEVALTFARVATAQAGGAHVLLVRAVEGEAVAGVDLTRRFPALGDDPLAAWRELGYDALAELATGAEAERFPLTALELPVAFAGPHIAAGTNFRAHAEEVMHEGEPFLFPKLSRPTPWNAAVPAASRLDYEAELCALTLGEVREPQQAELGFLLCNDFTDRWLLVRTMDLDAPMGRTGFAAAKGAAGFLPVGALLVIPRDGRGFPGSLQLELYVNDRLRQRVAASLMIWSSEEILRRALADCSVSYGTPEGVVTLTPCEGIPERTLLLTGTPGGVAFHPLNVWYPGAYLRPGDEVSTGGTYLGWLRNVVVE